MNTDFTNAIAVDKLLIKGVKINIGEILDNDSDGDKKKLAEKRKYIAVYNKDREEFDLEDLDDNINIIKRKMHDNVAFKVVNPV